MDKAKQHAQDLISRTRKDINKIKEDYQTWEQNYWNNNQDELKKQGWNKSTSSNSWGSTWSKTNVIPSTSTSEITNGKTTNVVQNKVQNPQNTTYSQKPNIDTPTVVQPTFTVNDYKNSRHFRHHHFLNDNAELTIDGKKYPIFVTQNLDPRNYSGSEENDRTYAIDPATGMIRKVKEDVFGMPYNFWSTENGGAEWFVPTFMLEEQWDKENPTPVKYSPTGGRTEEYKDYLQKKSDARKNGYKSTTNIQQRKQGGVMNRINYFQQGGAAPQQDMQQQIVALVQAAMQGDQKATQTVNQIMEAAKAGDQQAAQLAQMIQQVAKQMQGQATAAKWGAKLSYIRSLKYANGGKACPACQAGAPIKPTKKVEMKACGGKKAKKRYFGGWL